MEIIYYGHSCFLATVNEKKLLFDPYIRPNDLAKGIDFNKIEADYIFVSHGHADHVADLLELAHQTGALVVCAWEIFVWLQNQGYNHIHPMNTGGKKKFDFGWVKCVIAQHSSGMPDGSYGGNPMGFLIHTEDKSFYYSGDTALCIDMQLIPTWSPVDLAIFPIGDNFTMDAEDAALAAEWVKTPKVMGVHYDTFGLIEIDKEKAQQSFTKRGIELLLPKIGSSIII